MCFIWPKPVLLIAFTFLLSRISNAQVNYRVINWTVEKGLSQSTVYSVLEDKKGFIWLTSEDGLNRFDGNYFRTFQSSLEISSKNIIGVEMIGLVEDSLHNIWIGSDEGLNRFDIDKEIFTHFVNKNSANETLSNFIIPFLSTNTEVWCLEMSGDIAAYNTTTLEKKYLFKNVGWSVNYRSALEAKWDKIEKALWIPSDRGLIKILSNGIREYFFTDSNTSLFNTHINVYCLQIDYTRNCIWVGTSVGLFKKSFFAKEFERVSIPGYDVETAIGEVSIDKSGSLWLGTENKGVIVWSVDDLPNKIGRDDFSNTGLSSNNAGNIYFDKKGIVWISNGFTGIDQLFQSQINITSFTKSSLLYNASNSSIIRTISKWPDGRIAAGTEDSGIIILNPITHHIDYVNTSNTNGLISDYISFLKAVPNSHQVLIGSSTGMQLFDLEKKKFKTLHFKLANGQKTDSVYIKHFEVWGDRWIIATQNEGAFQFTTSQDTAYQIPGTQQSHVYYIGKVKEGALLVYWDRHSQLYNLKKNVLEKSAIDFEIMPILYCFYDSKNNDYWFGTVKGLRHTDANFKTLKNYTTKNGLANNFIYSVMPDNNGFLWLSTNKGISRFDRTHETFHNLYPTDGLQGFEYNSKACLIDSNMIYFGGMNGFDEIETLTFNYPNCSPSVYIKDVNVNGKELASEKLNLDNVFSYDQNNLSFNIGIIDFFNASNSRIQYKLEGAEDTWNFTESGNLTINFASLKPGNYILKLESYNRFLNKNEITKNFAFTITSPFWQTWWFFLLVCSSFVVLIYSFFSYRWNQKFKIIQIRDNLSRDLHDDIGGTLSSVRIYTEMLTRHPEEKSLLNLIQDNVLIMLDKLEVITWASNPKNDLFQNLIKEMEQFIIPLFHSKKIEYVFENQNISLSQTISGQIRQHLFLIFKEAINNIAKHAKCSHVEIIIHKQSGIFVLKITDNGNGFDRNTSHLGNGLKNIEHRAQKLNGQLVIESNSNGTRLMLKIPDAFK